MKCPSCGAENITGVDDCEECMVNLSSIDGVSRTKNQAKKSLMENTVEDLKPQDAIWISPKATVIEAVKLMNQNKMGSVLVSSNEKSLDGIITERDICFKVIAQKKDPAKVKIESVMTANPATLNGDDSLACALNQLAVGGYRHLPILREGEKTACISVREILKYLAKLFPETSR
jgi:predicted transcriptional regulator